VIAPVVPWSSLDRADVDVVVADVRSYLDGRSGREAYDGGHVPGAVFVPMGEVLSGPPSPQAGRHPLPEPDRFAAGLSALGIGDGSTVLAYDDAGGVMAARLVWLLRVTGREAALLDGGLQAYDGPLEREPARRPPAVLTPVPWPAARLATPEDAADPAQVVLDARDAERFRGEVEPVDPRAGHVPGARNVPCRANLGPDLRVLPADVLRQRYEDAGVRPGTPVVAYCGSGVTACHDLLTLEVAGLGPGRLYPGSWSQYSATDRPAALGDEGGA
jgi:thiosulfate/3-mercaptopyruvate sulfurtransferase